MEKVQKPSNSVCYTPSSEPFKIYCKIRAWKTTSKWGCVHILPFFSGSARRKYSEEEASHFEMVRKWLSVLGKFEIQVRL
jgi:hypothetical protein